MTQAVRARVVAVLVKALGNCGADAEEIFDLCSGAADDDVVVDQRLRRAARLALGGVAVVKDGELSVDLDNDPRLLDDSSLPNVAKTDEIVRMCDDLAESLDLGDIRCKTCGEKIVGMDFAIVRRVDEARKTVYKCKNPKCNQN